MLENIIAFSIRNKLIVVLFTLSVIAFGLFALSQLPIGAVPDITNNQVQVITTSRNLSTEDVEQFITYPVELEMANLPGVREIRSVSKFGLSVVTIVFDDKMGTYLPRQLIAEKIKAATDNIPESFGEPFMGPISTGLGEIYQYTLDTKPGYEGKYSAMDLRTIQDWIVKRHLSGIPGVVEINTWGGYLKQYEVAVDPEKLRAFNMTMPEVFRALKANNGVTGGGYIEKGNRSYFIRGEGLAKAISDIENIIIDRVDGIPVFVKDLAEVKFGYANRFGAITGNGEGEKVLGQIMMLKGGNSREIINNVKERVEEIQVLLPEGVYINGFLERSELIDRTTETITENLLLGCLIVIFVVILLLGDFRSGLVVASVIPLSLLFAISLMYVFNIDANLMSLGAIDFGIIIDGAVIIVEFIAFSVTQKKGSLENLRGEERKVLMDGISFTGASKMMKSAVFGQLIIIIVFIPILSLRSVEGKMFAPMAQTFCFALIGAMIFCFTYVPVVSSLFLRPPRSNKKSFSERLMESLQSMYLPVIRWALGHKNIVLGSSMALLAVSVFLFARMGGEFVPTLDEGDFVIQPVLKTGTSLSETIEITTEIEQILLDKFPEVDQVVSRIGAAEVPTDPMSMEEADVIIKLSPKSEWVSASSKDELADKIKSELELIAGLEYEFTQPIEMRFNELITGVRADVAIKIFGEDMKILAEKANEVKRLISGVEGASDIIVEKVEGLPQVMIKYDRQKLAKYGLNVSDLNEYVSLAFSGISAGSIFEGERRFDLTLRLQGHFREDLSSLGKLYIALPESDSQVPLRELAEIDYTAGPAKISRDNTMRRIVIGINVRNRDMESVVKDISSILDSELTLPSGYSVSYGGQFENLRSATKRLQLAVPIALLLIFIMLHFALGSFKQALLVYSAIPLAAVGGVLLLWIRGLPFSISAGVGFIALFGIAVLNGLVLIEHFKELKNNGLQSINELIIKGASERIRPVLLTASAAALGFFPMALSTSSGAEVQRPLATVVIGGLVTSTLLTLMVLPVLYAMFQEKRNNSKKLKPLITVLVLLAVFIGLPATVFGQNEPGELESIIEIASQQNAELKSEKLKVQQKQKLSAQSWNLHKTEVYYNSDENNIAENGYPIAVWGVSQYLEFPTVYMSQKRFAGYQYEMQQADYQVRLRELSKNVSQAYNEIIYVKHKTRIALFLDSLYDQFSQAAERRYELGETNYLEKLTAEARSNQIRTRLLQLREERDIAYKNLYQLVQSDSLFEISEETLLPIDNASFELKQSPEILYYEHAQNAALALNQVEKNKLLPDLSLEYFQGTNSNENARVYQGLQIGVHIPIFFGSQQAKIQCSRIQVEIENKRLLDYQRRIQAKIDVLRAQMDKYEEAINYYHETGSRLAWELLNTATRSYKEGEIDFLQYVQTIDHAKEIESEFLESVKMYNRTYYELKYITL